MADATQTERAELVDEALPPEPPDVEEGEDDDDESPFDLDAIAAYQLAESARLVVLVDSIERLARLLVTVREKPSEFSESSSVYLKDYDPATARSLSRTIREMSVQARKISLRSHLMPFYYSSVGVDL